jgi:hypothetical protein
MLRFTHTIFRFVSEGPAEGTTGFADAAEPQLCQSNVKAEKEARTMSFKSSLCDCFQSVGKCEKNLQLSLEVSVATNVSELLGFDGNKLDEKAVEGGKSFGQLESTKTDHNFFPRSYKC